MATPREFLRLLPNEKSIALFGKMSLAPRPVPDTSAVAIRFLDESVRLTVPKAYPTLPGLNVIRSVQVSPVANVAPFTQVPLNVLANTPPPIMPEITGAP